MFGSDLVLFAGRNRYGDHVSESERDIVGMAQAKKHTIQIDHVVDLVHFYRFGGCRIEPKTTNQRCEAEL